MRVTQLEGVHHSYVDRAMIATRMNLQDELDGKVVMIKSELQHQLNGVKESVGESLQAMRG